jgi:raffinose/stachyose/melibiose transport system permease protein
MIVPFQALMIPFISRFAPFVSINNRAALIFFYIGFGTALSTFLYHGFITTIPTEIDEAASTDGASDIKYPSVKSVKTYVDENAFNKIKKEAF